MDAKEKAKGGIVVNELFEKGREARNTLESFSDRKIAYVTEAHGAYVTEAAMDTGRPEEVKLDFLIVAVTEEGMSEEEFFAIWNAIDILSLAFSPC